MHSIHLVYCILYSGIVAMGYKPKVNKEGFIVKSSVLIISLNFIMPLLDAKVSMLPVVMHTHTKRLMKTKVARLTGHVISDLVICKFRKVWSNMTSNALTQTESR